MRSSLQLWHALECPYSMRSRIILREKKLEYSSHVVGLDDVGSDVRRLNPKGEVPVLLDGDFSVHEVDILLQYVDERYPIPTLMPTEPRGRAMARMWMDAIASELEPAIKVLEGPDGRGLDMRARREPEPADALRQVFRFLDRVNERLEEPFVQGRFGMVDLYVAPFLVDLDQLGVRRDEIPGRVLEWLGRLRDRPSVAIEARARASAIGRIERVAS